MLEFVFFFNQKTAYEMRISDWSSDVCSSDLLRNLIALRFPRHKLANDGTAFARGQAVVTPKVIRSEIVARFRQWEEAGLAEGIDQFKSDLLVERDANDPNRVNALVPPDIVNQLRVFAGQIQFRL